MKFFAGFQGHRVVPLFIFVLITIGKGFSKDYSCYIPMGLGMAVALNHDRNLSAYLTTHYEQLSSFSLAGRADMALGILLVHGVYSLGGKRNISFEKRVFLSMVSSGAFVTLLKYTLHRTRPNTGHNTLKGPSLSAENVSFPSGHTQVAFTLASSFTEEYGHPVLFYGLAVLVGVARIASDMHYLSDVIFGAYSGYYISKIVFSKPFYPRLFIVKSEPFGVSLFYSLR